jgi:hypothetical protein
MDGEHDGIYDIESTISARLLRWAAGSVLAGTPLALVGSPFWRGFGVQTAAWGLIDGVIALAGARGAAAKAARPESHPPARQAEEAATLRRVLGINAGLDVAYVLGGLVLARTRGRKEPFLRGTGWGIVAQGAFLLGFDLVHRRLIPRR